MKRLSDLFRPGLSEENFRIGRPEQFEWMKKERKKLHLFALGDVGGTLLTGLKLLGGDQIEEIGIYDIRDAMASRYEMEMNQVREGDDSRHFPPVRVLKRQELFQCDIFCSAHLSAYRRWKNPLGMCGWRSIRQMQA